MFYSATLPCSWSRQPAMLPGLQPDSGLSQMGQSGRNSFQGDKSQQKNPLGPWRKGKSHASSLIKITASQVADAFPLSW